MGERSGKSLWRKGHLEWVSRDGQGVGESRWRTEQNFWVVGTALALAWRWGGGCAGLVPCGKQGRLSDGWGLTTVGFEWQGSASSFCRGNHQGEPLGLGSGRTPRGKPPGMRLGQAGQKQMGWEQTQVGNSEAACKTASWQDCDKARFEVCRGLRKTSVCP